MQSSQPFHNSRKSQLFLVTRYDPVKRMEVTVVHKQFLANGPDVYREILLHRVASERISHGIVRFVTEYATQGRPGFLMEACKKESLLRMAELNEARNTRWTEQELTVILLNMLATVQKLHRIRIVHNAINAENWLLTSDGEVKLTDFGAAELVPRSNEVEAQETLSTLPENQFLTDLRGIGSSLYQVTMPSGRISERAGRDQQIRQRFKEIRYSPQLAAWVIDLLSAKSSLDELLSAVQVEQARGSL